MVEWCFLYLLVHKYISKPVLAVVFQNLCRLTSSLAYSKLTLKY